MSRNFLGGFYQPGKPLPVFVREEIVDLYNNGVGVSEISRNARVTKEAVHKVVQHFALHSTTQPFSCGGILEVIEIWKLWKPSLYASEIRERPLREGSCTPANVCEIFNWMIPLGLCKVRTGWRRMADGGWRMADRKMQMIKSLWGKINLRCSWKYRL